MEALQSAAAASPLSVGSHSSAALDGDPPIPAYLPPTGVRSAGASSKSLRMTLDLGRLHSSPPASLGSPRSKVGLLWGCMTCACAAWLHRGLGAAVRPPELKHLVWGSALLCAAREAGTCGD